jgi:flagellar export protein FliJ
MRPFRFRADAAIDLRRSEYDEARRVLARTEMDLNAARALRADAAARLDKAREACRCELSAGHDSSRWPWYQAWLLRLEHERAVCVADVAARERDVTRASAAVVRARQRLEALERLRDRAREAWERASAAEEQKQIDVLATMRHVAALRESAQRSRT